MIFAKKYKEIVNCNSKIIEVHVEHDMIKPYIWVKSWCIYHW